MLTAAQQRALALFATALYLADWDHQRIEYINRQTLIVHNHPRQAKRGSYL